MLDPHAVCDGGDLDCGSGLLLIINKNMSPLIEGQVLEIRSRESTVADDLPAWCRMVKHEFLGSEPGDDTVRYFVRKGQTESNIEKDLEAAKGYKWNVRVQGEKGLRAKVYARNHRFYSGQPAEFSPNVDAPSAVDYLITSLASCLAVGYKAHASRRNVTVDQIELSLKGEIENILYHMEIEESGNPSLKQISGTCYVSSSADEKLLEEIWQITLDRSPIYQTLKKAVEINLVFSLVY
ncbi:sulfurtransferase TusA family protein [Cytobacillus dafuensis]|uniref:Osmotically inducible protein OsmC n=1 Tax=Cytobacillus dafuensis TaxID=1742359 RepID=A0A5B8ZBG8_CYTDA|nr:OsmC family protein [Cytobacillus dafuensis]QED49009.1 osmotically inducible protein OsmC [Cytobacillus dafuensis]